MLRQLSAQDASFIYMETPATPMHVGSLGIYDPSTTAIDEYTEEMFLRFVEERLHLLGMSRQRLVPVPFNADHPYWMEDGDFDLEYHIRRIAVPRPADWNALYKLAARIFSRPLDMNKPLWEMYLIEGLDNLEGVPAGSFALLTKTHHAAVDGASGQHMMEMIHDLEPTPRPVQPPESPWRPDPLPSDPELMMRAVGTNLAQPFRFMQVFSDTMGAMGKAGSTLGRAGAARPFQVPRTRFNGKVTPHRVIGYTKIALDDVRSIRKAVAGATVNDVVLAICGGGLRRYLLAKNEVPADSMVAMAPVNVRVEGDTQIGNQVAAMFIPIGTDIADPVERLAAVRGFTRESKEINNAIGARLMTDYRQFVPAVTAAQAGRLMSSLANVQQPTFNVSITNVPGPQVPLYAMGAKLLTNMGLGPVTHGMGMIMPVTSYCGEIYIGFTSCREMLPDPDFYTECLEESFTELMAATTLVKEVDVSVPVKEPVKKPRKRSVKGGGANSSGGKQDAEN
jgi:diacylglycerol O-acyltransferase